MTRRFILLLLIAAATVLPVAAAADSGFWTNREICRAATKTYFFLRGKPADAKASDELFGFRSEAGYVYTCRINGTQIEFRWVDTSGATMQSDTTTFRMSDDILFVHTDMKEEGFPPD